MIQYQPVAAASVPRAELHQLADYSGDTRTGLTIFRPTDGLDEGPIILQHEVPIGADDTLGTLYFNHLFPWDQRASGGCDLVLSGGSGRAHRMSPRQVTKVGAAPPNPASTGTITSI